MINIVIPFIITLLLALTGISYFLSIRKVEKWFKDSNSYNVVYINGVPEVHRSKQRR